MTKGDEVIIVDIHPKDTHYKKKDLFINKKAIILAPPSVRWIRNRHMKEWLSLALKIDGEVFWFYGVKIETINFDENQ
jgi:hypothetical protein